MLDGLLVVYKPAGPSSYDVIRRLKKVLGRDIRIGHCGTLDPAAEGILLVLLGKATRRQSELMNLVKTYRVTIRLGQRTSTGDRQGQVIEELPVGDLSVGDVEKVLNRFIGEISQVPPMYSAVHYGGRRLYELARKDIIVERAARKVKIYSLQLVNLTLPRLVLRVKCSAGTYMRALAEDIARACGTVGMVEELVREKVGDFDRSISLDYSDIESTLRKEDLSQKILVAYA